MALVGADGRRRSPGAVPPGHYRVLATFSDGDEGHAGDLDVTAGGTFVVRCKDAFRQCSVEAP